MNVFKINLRERTVTLPDTISFFVKLCVVISILAMALPVLGQDTPPILDGVDTSGITDDQVNSIAQQLYCPVCENIPLDTCGTAACEDWRQEIRGMLASGMPAEAIVDNFVTRFGDRVVSSPRDPVIAAISNITPWVVLIIAAGFAIYQLFQWNGKRAVQVTDDLTPDIPEAQQRYLEQLEQDLAGK